MQSSSWFDFVWVAITNILPNFQLVFLFSHGFYIDSLSSHKINALLIIIINVDWICISQNKWSFGASLQLLVVAFLTWVLQWNLPGQNNLEWTKKISWRFQEPCPYLSFPVVLIVSVFWDYLKNWNLKIIDGSGEMDLSGKYCTRHPHHCYYNAKRGSSVHFYSISSIFSSAVDFWSFAMENVILNVPPHDKLSQLWGFNDRRCVRSDFFFLGQNVWFSFGIF